MESSTKTQFEKLEERIECEEIVFGSSTTYYEFSDSETSVYTLSNNPKANDMTYLYEDYEFVANATITSVDGENHTITIGETIYTLTNNTISYNDLYVKVLKNLLEDSKHVGLSLRFPYVDDWDIDLPKKYLNWQIRCCLEIYEQIGTIGLKSYTENGLSWTRDSTYISNELRNEIEPMIGYIDEVDENDSEEVQAEE